MSNPSLSDSFKTLRGEIEILTKDVNGNVISSFRQPNLIKASAKEILAKMVTNRIWNGVQWEDNDTNEEFELKYFLFGASFDENYAALGSSDPRFYTVNQLTNAITPIQLSPGGDYLINPIPLRESENLPLKRIESMTWEASYQPSDTPYLNSDVRPMNNVLVLGTTIKPFEYNGLDSNGYFTITEIALASGKEIDSDAASELTGSSRTIAQCLPEHVFLEGVGESSINQVIGSISGNTFSIDPSVADPDSIKIGDKVLIVQRSINAEITAPSSGNVISILPADAANLLSYIGGSVPVDGAPAAVDVGGALNLIKITAINTGTGEVTFVKQTTLGQDELGGLAVSISDSIFVENYNLLDQTNPWYLVMSKQVGGRDVVLDRTPKDSDNVEVSGPAGIYRSTNRLFAHRILNAPVTKSSVYELEIKWRIIFG